MSCFDNGNCNAVQIEYDGNGSLTDYTFPFEYQIEEEVHVEKWNPDTLRYIRVNRNQWSFKEMTMIQFVTAPDYTFRIMRETDLDDLAKFYPGSSIKSDDLNDNFEQLKFAIEEGWCRVSTEFYCYLEEYIWDKRDAITIEDQQNNRWQNVDTKIATAGAIGARTDVYMQDPKPAKPPYEQPGKRWYDTTQLSNYIWDADIEAWVDYSRTGPQGPKGADGHHQVILGLEPPTHRPSGDPIGTGDIWFNTCTGETFIYYDGNWMSLVVGGPKGEKGDAGQAGEQVWIGDTAPDDKDTYPLWFDTKCGDFLVWYEDEGYWVSLIKPGKDGAPGTDYQTICSLDDPKTRNDGSALQCGDLWFNTCKGEMYVYYNGNWLTVSSATGPEGPQGKPGPTGPPGPPAYVWFGDEPPESHITYPLWYDTKCEPGFYAWNSEQHVWTEVTKPGPQGKSGSGSDLTALQTESPIEFDGTDTLSFSLSTLTEI
jgi:hypothetical protein